MGTTIDPVQGETETHGSRHQQRRHRRSGTPIGLASSGAISVLSSNTICCRKTCRQRCGSSRSCWQSSAPDSVLAVISLVLVVRL